MYILWPCHFSFDLQSFAFFYEHFACTRNAHIQFFDCQDKKKCSCPCSTIPKSGCSEASKMGSLEQAKVNCCNTINWDLLSNYGKIMMGHLGVVVSNYNNLEES